MKIAFRVDASLSIGTGHVMRCLTLAEALRSQGADCIFICRPHLGNLMSQIEQRGHCVLQLPTLNSHYSLEEGHLIHADWLGVDWQTDATDTQAVIEDEQVDWLIIDHYALDSRWENRLRPYCRQMMAIDDLADRSHVCDLLLDQNLGRVEGDYDGLVSSDCKLLIGPKYALLRPEFAQKRQASLMRRDQQQHLQNILISMGGVDKDNITSLVLNGLDACNLKESVRITVVMGFKAPWLQEVKQRAADMKTPTQVLVGVNDMAELMKDSDLMICAAGGTSWERCCLGVPGVQLVLAENQVRIAAALLQVGAAMTADLDTFEPTIREIFSSEDRLNELLATTYGARSVLSGLGAQDVSDQLIGAQV